MNKHDIFDHSLIIGYRIDSLTHQPRYAGTVANIVDPEKTAVCGFSEGHALFD